MTENVFTRQDYLALFPSLSEAISFEHLCLSHVAGQVEALQAPAVCEAVIGGHDVEDDHPVYWAWLGEQYEGARELSATEAAHVRGVLAAHRVEPIE